MTCWCAACTAELTGNVTQQNITTNFFNILVAGQDKAWDPSAPGGHSFATGGSNDNEHWYAASKLGDSLNARTEESCTTYNVLKVARHLFTWSADARLADFYERALQNGILGNQNERPPHSPAYGPHSTGLEYMLPLGGGGLTKPFRPASPHSSFPCCWGTLSETYAKLADSIWFRSPSDNSTLFLNLFESSTVQMPSGATVEQVAGFPLSTTSTTTVRVSGGNVSLRLRVPWWATDTAGNCVRLNGKTIATSRVIPSTCEQSTAWQALHVLLS
eukprot:COSAG01_NODE_1153_length_11487_cov_98.298736_8_plen_274_part_00